MKGKESLDDRNSRDKGRRELMMGPQREGEGRSWRKKATEGESKGRKGGRQENK